MTIRAIYERRKDDFLNTQSAKKEEENAPKPEEDKQEVIDGFYKHQDLLDTNTRGTTLAPDTVKDALSKMGKSSNREAVRKWKRILEKEHTELIKNISLRKNPPKEYPEDTLLA